MSHVLRECSAYSSVRASYMKKLFLIINIIALLLLMYIY